MKLTRTELNIPKFHDVDTILSYSCKLTLPISRIQVDAFFETKSKENEPSQSQINFIEYLINNFEKILNIISENIHQEIAGISLTRLKEDFDLDTLGVSANINKEIKWDLSLKSRSHNSLSILANFEGLTPSKIWIEKESRFISLLKIFKIIK